MANPFKDYIVKLRAGDLVFKDGDPGTEMYIVQSGRVEIFADSPKGPHVVAVMEKGDFFGEMALLDGMPHTASARAIEDCELIEINSTLFDRMIKANAEIAVRMLRKLSIRLRETVKRHDALAQSAPPAPQAQAPAPTPVTASIPPAVAIAGSAPREATPSESVPAVQAMPPEPTPPVEAAPRGPIPIAIGPKGDGSHAWLHSEDGKEWFPLSSARAAIGRFDPVTGLKPEVDLSTLDINRSVSRHHARLTLEGGVYYLVEEPGALNGTFINGRKLITGKPTRVKDGDGVGMGMVKLVFREAGKA